jgi:hypothetical protein
VFIQSGKSSGEKPTCTLLLSMLGHCSIGGTDISLLICEPRAAFHMEFPVCCFWDVEHFEISIPFYQVMGICTHKWQKNKLFYWGFPLGFALCGSMLTSAQQSPFVIPWSLQQDLRSQCLSSESRTEWSTCLGFPWKNLGIHLGLSGLAHVIDSWMFGGTVFRANGYSKANKACI